MSKKRVDTPDTGNPEWTAERMRNALRFEQLPSELQTILRRRGPQKAPTKVQTAVRYDVEVIEAFKATGRGWQTRMNDALKDWLKTHKPA